MELPRAMPCFLAPIVAGMVPRILLPRIIETEAIDRLLRTEYPFEAYFDIFLKAGEPRHLFEIFRSGRPGNVHVFLARLVAAGLLKTIVTTNFDLLLEKAFEQEGLEEPADFITVHCESDYLEAIRNPKPVIYKLHGTATDPGGLGITVERVAMRRQSGAQSEVIRHLFASGPHDQVVIVGYSCSDSFDITPQIEAALAESIKQIVLIDHSLTVENATTLGARRPFSRYSRFGRLRCNTDLFVARLAMSVLNCQVNRRRVKPLWKFHVRRWIAWNTRDRTRAFVNSVLGAIFSAQSDFVSAAVCWEKGLRISRRLRHGQAIAAFLGNLGNELARLGRFEDAMARYAEVESIQGASISDKIIHHNSVGVLHMHKGEYRQAVLAWAKTVDLGTLEMRSSSEVRTIANLATLLGNLGRWSEARFILRKALETSRKKGMVFNECVVLNQLGVLFIKEREWSNATKCLSKALAIASELHDICMEGSIVGNLGTVESNLGRFDEAVLHLERAVAIARQTGDLRQLGVRMANMGNIYLRRQLFSDAIELYREALTIANRIGDKQGFASRSFNLGQAYVGLGEVAESRRLISQAVVAYRALFDDRPAHIIEIEKLFPDL